MSTTTESLVQHATRSFKQSFPQSSWIAPHAVKAICAVASHKLMYNPPAQLLSLAARVKTNPMAIGFQIARHWVDQRLPLGLTVAALGSSLVCGYATAYVLRNETQTLLNPEPSNRTQLARLKNKLTAQEEQHYGRTFQHLSLEERQQQLITSFAEALAAKNNDVKQLKGPAPVPNTMEMSEPPKPPRVKSGAGEPKVAASASMTSKEIIDFFKLPAAQQQTAFNDLPQAKKQQILEQQDIIKGLAPPAAT